jgi:hypothetical protein
MAIFKVNTYLSVYFYQRKIFLKSLVVRCVQFKIFEKNFVSPTSMNILFFFSVYAPSKIFFSNLSNKINCKIIFFQSILCDKLENNIYEVVQTEKKK